MMSDDDRELANLTDYLTDAVNNGDAVDGVAETFDGPINQFRILRPDGRRALVTVEWD